jgi:hypothetical protein
MKHSWWHLMLVIHAFLKENILHRLFAWHWTSIFTCYLSEQFSSFFQHAKWYKINFSWIQASPWESNITLVLAYCMFVMLLWLSECPRFDSHHGQAYFSILPSVDIYTQSNITNIIFARVHNTNTEKKTYCISAISA